MANRVTHGKRFHGTPVALALFFTAIVVAATVYFSSDTKLKNPTLLGKQAPDIEFEMSTGQTTSISKKKGTALLLNFWASWCRPCLEEIPSLHMLEKHFEGQGLVVLAFNMEDAGEAVRGKIKGLKAPQNLIFNFSKEALRPYHVNSLPISVLIDRFGVIERVYNGPRNWMDLSVLREIEMALK